MKRKLEELNDRLENVISAKPLTVIGLLFVSVILFCVVLFRSPETITIEVEKIVEVETKVIEYIDSETNEQIETYWYYSYNTLDGRVGYGTAKCGPKFEYSNIFNKIRERLEKRHKGKDYSFIKFENIQEIDKESHED